MVNDTSIKALQIKPLENNSQDQDLLYEKVSEQDVQYFEDYLWYTPCSQCGKDHRFRPIFKKVQTSIDYASELVVLFFNEGSNKVE
jgi:hypothetical protein